MKTKSILMLVAICGVTAISSCKKDVTPAPENPSTPSTPSYTVATTYNYDSADFSSSTKRISMLNEIKTYIATAHTTTATTQPTLNGQKLKDMFANLNAQFADGTLNSSGLQLKDQTNNTFNFVTSLEANFMDADSASVTAAANPTVSTASNGVRGKLVSSVRAVLVDANGFEYKEGAEKGLMGAALYYQAMLRLNNISGYDNVIKINGLTAQQRAWDEAFGLFGVPVDFPTTTTGLKFWGSYSNSLNSALSCNATMMNGFLKGRAAINNNDASGRDEAKASLVLTWEKIAAAKCISYLKAAKTNLSDAPTLHHNLSEGYGFILAFRYNNSKTISDADITTLLGYYGGNLYTMSVTNIDATINKLATVFSLDPNVIP